MKGRFKTSIPILVMVYLLITSFIPVSAVDNEYDGFVKNPNIWDDLKETGKKDVNGTEVKTYTGPVSYTHLTLPTN